MSTASRSGPARDSGPMRGRIEERINSGSPECRPRTVPHHVGKSGYPTAARHRPTDPAHRRPEEEDRATDEGRAADSEDLRRARQPKPCRCHVRRRDKNRGGAAGKAAGGTAAAWRERRAAQRRGAASSYSATFCAQCACSSRRNHESSAEVWPRHSTR